VDRATETAGALLRQARTGAGLSQAELAARAGVTQSVISAYESGHRQPALGTLATLIEAAGYELVIDVRRQPRRLSRTASGLPCLVSHTSSPLAASSASCPRTGRASSTPTNRSTADHQP